MLIPQDQWLVCNWVERWHSVHQDQLGVGAGRGSLYPEHFYWSHQCRCCSPSEVRNWRKFGKEGLTLAKVSDCSQLEINDVIPCVPPSAPGLASSWAEVVELFSVAWTLGVEGDFSTHNIPSLRKWKSRISSNSDNSQHPIISSGPRKESTNLFISDVSVEETFFNSWHYPEVLWHLTA